MKLFLRKSTAMLLALLLVMSSLSGITITSFADSGSTPLPVGATLESVDGNPVEISGTYGTELENSVELKLTLTSDSFVDTIVPGTDVSLWLADDMGFNQTIADHEASNLPCDCAYHTEGFKVSVKEVASDKTYVVVELSGTPNKTSNELVVFEVPADALAGGAALKSADNADIKYSIAKRPITVKSGSFDKVYDGKPLRDTDQVLEIIGEFARGDGKNGQLSALATITNVGTVVNEIESFTVWHNGYDEDGKAKAVNVTAYYDITIDEGTLTVNPAPLTITLNTINKVYGDTIDLPGYVKLAYEGFVNGENESVLAGSPLFTTTYDVTDPANRGVGEYAVTLSGITGGNYAITVVDGKLIITPAPLTITVDDVALTYGDDKPTYTVSYDGFKYTDDASVLSGLKIESSYEKGSPVGNYGIVASGATADNYNISYIDGTVAVGKKLLTVVITADDKTYDGTDKATGTYTLVGLEPGDTVELVGGEYKFNDKNAGDDKTVTFSGYSLPAGSNYVLANASASTTADIAQKELTVTITANDKVYDATADATVDYTVDGVVAGDSISLVGGSASFDDKNAGDNKTVTFSGYSITDGNYYLGNLSATAEASITKAPLTIEADDFVIIYGNDAPLYTSQISGFVGGEDESVLTGTLSYDCSYVKGDAVGQYTITPLGYTSENYEITYLPGTLSVEQKVVEISFTVEDKEYDGTTAATLKDVVLDGVEAGDDVVFTGDTLVYTFEKAGVGTDIAVKATGFSEDLVTGADKANYKIIFNDTAFADITAKELVVTSNDVTAIYGDRVDALFSYTVSGFVAGEDESVLDLSGVTFTTPYQEGENIGTYAISVSGFDAENYYFTYVDGTLTIEKRAITIKTGSGSKVYDGTPFWVDDHEVTAGTIFSGDTLSMVYGSGIVLYKESGADNTATAVITSLYGEDKTGNYDITYDFGKLYIEKRVISIRTEDASKVYDGTALENHHYVLSGAIATTDNLVVQITGSREVPGTSENTIGKLVITNNLTAEEVTDNYDIAVTLGTLTVLAAQYDVTITAGSGTWIFDNTDKTVITYTYTGDLMNGDKFVVTFKDTSVIRYVGSTANEIDTVKVIHVSADGTETDVTECYNITTVAGTLTVEKATISVVFDDINTMYDGNTYGDDDSTYTITVPGGFTGYTVSLKDLVTLKDVGTILRDGKVVVLDLDGVTDIGGNFDLVKNDAYITITKRSVTITANGVTALYDGTEKAATYTISGDGFVTGEGAAITVSGARVDAGESDAIVSYTLDAGTLAGNYDITTVDAKVIVTKRQITITADSGEREYNGIVFSKETYTIGGDGFADGEGLGEVTFELSNAKFAGDTHVNKILDYKFADGTNENNYEVTGVYDGLLEVTKAQIQIAINGNYDEYEYDGTQHTGSYKVVGQLAAGDTLIVATYGLITNAGEKSFIIFEDLVRVYHNLKDDGTSEKDVTDNYVITTSNGTIKVTEKVIIISPVLGQGKKVNTSEPAELLFTHTPLVGSDKLEGVLARAPGEDIGEYAYDISGITASSNYKLVLDSSADKFAVRSAVFEVTGGSGVTIEDGKFLAGTQTGATANDVLSQFDNAEAIIVKDADGNVLADDAAVGTGTKLVLMEGTEVVTEITVVIAGDTNGDGKVDTADYMALQQQVAGDGTLEGAYVEAADYNGDGVVNAIDYLLVKYLVVQNP